MEGLDHVELLAHADELDRLARRGADRQRCAASGVAVELGEHHARHAQGLVKGCRGVDRVLARHRIDDQQDLGGFDRVADAPQLVHQLLVDVQAAGRVKKDQVVAVLLRMLDRGFGDVHGVGLSHLEHGDVQLPADGLQLRDGGGTVDVAGGQQRTFTLLAHIGGELGPVRGLARALQADEHHDARRFRGDVQLLVRPAHEGAELLVDDLDDHLRRGEGLEHVGSAGAFGHGLGEVLDDLVADVRFQQGHAHLAHRLAHVGGGQSAFAAQALESRIQFFG